MRHVKRFNILEVCSMLRLIMLVIGHPTQRFLYCKPMASPWKLHVVLSGSIEHALLKSASTATPRTRRQLLVIAIQQGLSLYEEQTVTTALHRLSATGLLKSSRGYGALRSYHLTQQGEQVLQVFAESPA